MNKPILYMLCGLPCSGKTTLGENFCSPEKFYSVELISSDAIRKELYGDESIQGDPSEVFELMQNRTLEMLSKGQDVMYDATNITRKDRASILKRCPDYVEKKCIIIWARLETCIKRDKERERSVGEDVIMKMVKRFQAPFYDEGFSDINIEFTDKFSIWDYEDDIINNMSIPHDNHHHTLDIDKHCEESERIFCELVKSNLKIKYYIDTYTIRESLYYHDIGKPLVKSFTNAKGEASEEAHYYQHQCVGAYLSYGLKKMDTIWIAWIISTHMDPYLNTKYYRNLPTYLKEIIDVVHECDEKAQST